VGAHSLKTSKAIAITTVPPLISIVPGPIAICRYSGNGEEEEEEGFASSSSASFQLNGFDVGSDKFRGGNTVSRWETRAICGRITSDSAIDLMNTCGQGVSGASGASGVAAAAMEAKRFAGKRSLWVNWAKERTLAACPVKELWATWLDRILK